MSLAHYLGVETEDTPLMKSARAAWREWQVAEPVLRVVRELTELREWGMSADYETRDLAWAALIRIGAVDGNDIPEATTAMTWLLLPGADRFVRTLADRTDDAPGIVATNLWIATKTANWRKPRYIASAILNETKRNSLAELGLGDRGTRLDRAWANTVPLSNLLDHFADSELDETPPFVEVLQRTLNHAITTELITETEAGLVLEVADIAHRLDKPANRGCGGLFTAEIGEIVGANRNLSGRQIRRRLTRIIERLSTLSETQDVMSHIWSAA